ncbi:MAG: LysR family transcriptional regulator [Nannocystaceae bacterium]|nr:LysR family transcriptional regulator [Nannocystaceae bacterium]
MDQLGALSLFNKVVETGSFSEAGRQSNLAPSSVSRRVSDLEAWVGATLFHRTTRKLNLTEVGRLFHERTRNILLDLEEARVIAAESEDKPSGLVRITLPASLESHIVVATAIFQAKWPDVSFGLTSTDRKVDLVGEGFDLAIRAGRLNDSTLRARKIAEVPRSLCASPRYLASAPPLVCPQDVAHHECLTLGRKSGDHTWRFKDGDSIIEVRASGRMAANSGNMLLTAARNGCGLMLSPAWVMGPSIASGELVRVLPDTPPDPPYSALYVVHPYQRFIPPKVRVLIDFLVGYFGDSYDWSRCAAVRTGSHVHSDG